jgi:hypothetical protein
MPSKSETSKKTYSPPKLNKLTPEQAKLILIGHASCGDQKAKDFLEVFYPLSGTREITASARMSKTRNLPKSNLDRPPRLIRRAVTAFQSKGEEFRRFIRG